MDQIEILSESVIKIENIKQEPDHHPEEEAWNFKDPLALDNAVFCCKSEESAGGDYDAEDTVIDWVTRTGSVMEESSICIVENEPTLLSAGAKPIESVAGKKNSAKNASSFSKRNSTSENEQSVCGETHNAEGAHKCSDCHKSFKWRSDLVVHMAIHSGKRPLQCSVCQKSFSRRSNLVRHMRIHKGELPYECPDCQKGFTRKIGLKRHLRIHKGELPYECPDCQKGFRQKSDLKRHMLIHSGERPFECSDCQKSFSQRSNLVTHMRIHSGKRPFECAVCQKSFSRRRHIVTHMRNHSNGHF